MTFFVIWNVVFDFCKETSFPFCDLKVMISRIKNWHNTAVKLNMKIFGVKYKVFTSYNERKIILFRVLPHRSFDATEGQFYLFSSLLSTCHHPGLSVSQVFIFFFNSFDDLLQLLLQITQHLSLFFRDLTKMGYKHSCKAGHWNLSVNEQRGRNSVEENNLVAWSENCFYMTQTFYSCTAGRKITEHHHQLLLLHPKITKRKEFSLHARCAHHVAVTTKCTKQFMTYDSTQNRLPCHYRHVRAHNDKYRNCDCPAWPSILTTAGTLPTNSKRSPVAIHQNHRSTTVKT